MKNCNYCQAEFNAKIDDLNERIEKLTDQIQAEASNLRTQVEQNPNFINRDIWISTLNRIQLSAAKVTEQFI